MGTFPGTFPMPTPVPVSFLSCFLNTSGSTNFPSNPNLSVLFGDRKPACARVFGDAEAIEENPYADCVRFRRFGLEGVKSWLSDGDEDDGGDGTCPPLKRLEADLPIVSSWKSLPVVLSLVGPVADAAFDFFAGAFASPVDGGMIGPPRATVYRFLGVGLTLFGLLVYDGFGGAGRPDGLVGGSPVIPNPIPGNPDIEPVAEDMEPVGEP
jgi:hypothetical protein